MTMKDDTVPLEPGKKSLERIHTKVDLDDQLRDLLALFELIVFTLLPHRGIGDDGATPLADIVHEHGHLFRHVAVNDLAFAISVRHQRIHPLAASAREPQDGELHRAVNYLFRAIQFDLLRELAGVEPQMVRDSRGGCSSGRKWHHQELPEPLCCFEAGKKSLDQIRAKSDPDDQLPDLAALVEFLISKLFPDAYFEEVDGRRMNVPLRTALQECEEAFSSATHKRLWDSITVRNKRTHGLRGNQQPATDEQVVESVACLLTVIEDDLLPQLRRTDELLASRIENANRHIVATDKADPGADCQRTNHLRHGIVPLRR